MALPFDTCRDAAAWHLVQRARCPDGCFRHDTDYQAYAYWLKRYASRYDVTLHAWVFLPDHVHLLVSSRDPWSIAEMLNCVARQYQHHYQARYGGWAAVWREHYAAHPVADAERVLWCYRFIELHPVRDGHVVDAGQYRWSSYSCNALGQDDGLCRPHRAYLDLASDRLARGLAYQAHFMHALPAAAEADIRRCLAEGTRLQGRGRDQREL